jgi:hypothetical protein
MFSFENFPENASTQVKLTPRSNESLKRTGIKIEDLVQRTAEDINTKYGDNITDKNLIEKRLIHYD